MVGGPALGVLLKQGGTGLISGNLTQLARPRSTASDTQTLEPWRRNRVSKPSRPSGVVSQVTPVRALQGRPLHRGFVTQRTPEKAYAFSGVFCVIWRFRAAGKARRRTGGKPPIRRSFSGRAFYLANSSASSLVTRRYSSISSTVWQCIGETRMAPVRPTPSTMRLEYTLLFTRSNTVTPRF